MRSMVVVMLSPPPLVAGARVQLRSFPKDQRVLGAVGRKKMGVHLEFAGRRFVLRPQAPFKLREVCLPGLVKSMSDDSEGLPLSLQALNSS